MTTWTLNAHGSCASEEDERDLVAKLNRVLSGAKAGTTASGFTGEHHRGPAHGMPDQEMESLSAQLRAAERKRASRSGEE